MVRRVVIGVVVAALAGGLVLWRLLDFETGIVGVVDLVALPNGGAAVAWSDYSGDTPAGRLVIGVRLS
ncbi:MAG: hypothetical protein LC733_06545 [Actinobacteria bacterium]|nr:hypothetical protein [Actinomycetota bacterium]